MLISTFHNNMFENSKFTPKGLTATNCNFYNYEICQNLRIESENVYSIESMSKPTMKYNHQRYKLAKIENDDTSAAIFNPSLKYSEKINSSTRKPRKN